MNKMSPRHRCPQFKVALQQTSFPRNCRLARATREAMTLGGRGARGIWSRDLRARARLAALLTAMLPPVLPALLPSRSPALSPAFLLHCCLPCSLQASLPAAELATLMPRGPYVNSSEVPSLTSKKTGPTKPASLKCTKRHTRFGNRTDGRLCCTLFSELCDHVRRKGICAANRTTSSAN